MSYSNLPFWAFGAARYLAKMRARFFRNEFFNARLREMHGITPYVDHVESIAGYLGEIAGASFVGQDPLTALEETIRATNGLTRRDPGDFTYRGLSIDVKIEDFGTCHDKVIHGRQRFDQTYGCRLVNYAQWLDNRANIDLYLFGTFDPPIERGRLLSQARRIRWLGLADSAMVDQASYGIRTPGGHKLPSAAKFIPHSTLLPLPMLDMIPQGFRRVPAGSTLRASEARRITDTCDALRLIADQGAASAAA